MVAKEDWIAKGRKGRRTRRVVAPIHRRTRRDGSSSRTLPKNAPISLSCCGQTSESWRRTEPQKRWRDVPTGESWSFRFDWPVGLCYNRIATRRGSPLPRSLLRRGSPCVRRRAFLRGKSCSQCQVSPRAGRGDVHGGESSHRGRTAVAACRRQDGAVHLCATATAFALPGEKRLPR